MISPMLGSHPPFLISTSWLVVYLPLWKNMKVKWEYDSQYLEKWTMFQTTNISFFPSSSVFHQLHHQVTIDSLAGTASLTALASASTAPGIGLDWRDPSTVPHGFCGTTQKGPKKVPQFGVMLSWGSRNSNFTTGFMVDIPWYTYTILYLMGLINQQTSLGGHHLVPKRAIFPRIRAHLAPPRVPLGAKWARAVLSEGSASTRSPWSCLTIGKP